MLYAGTTGSPNSQRVEHQPRAKKSILRRSVTHDVLKEKSKKKNDKKSEKYIYRHSISSSSSSSSSSKSSDKKKDQKKESKSTSKHTHKVTTDSKVVEKETKGLVHSKLEQREGIHL